MSRRRKPPKHRSTTVAVRTAVQAVATHEYYRQLAAETLRWPYPGASWLVRPRPRGNVYVLHAAEVDRYKIGYTGAANVQERIRSFQCGSPVPLALVAVLPHATELDEAALHIRFAFTRLHGEWFASSAGLRAFVQSHRTPECAQ